MIDWHVSLPRIKFLFWNLNRKPLAALVAELVSRHSVDIIVLAECESEIHVLLELNRAEVAFHLPLNLCPRIRLFTRFAREFAIPRFSNERIAIHAIHLARTKPILLTSVHLPSKLHWDRQSQAFECAELIRKVEQEERVAGHQRTILVGDFNMNPFEDGVVSSVGLNCVPSRQLAGRIKRTVQDREYHFFYNPMWAKFGDALQPTAGSYYYDSGQHLNHYWNIFDQVLLRPELAAAFDPTNLHLLTSVGNSSLVTADGRPDSKNASDHLPLLFEVEF